MATRIKDWEVPYTWWIWIEITNNHVINVLLRELNNLIHVNENRELYVDLQLDDWIQPDDDFPVGVTTWKILQEDWWQQSWIILNWKTTSWDYVRLIYANDGKLYYDPWTWEWIQITTWWDLPWVATSTELWLVKLGSDVEQTESIETPTATAGRTYAVQLNADNQAVVNVPWENAEYESLPEEQWWTDESLVTTWEKYIWNHKQDALTAGTRITIDQNNVISADISGVMTYMWNVTDSSQLPASWNQWDCWYDETAKTLWAWDGTQWNDIGGTGIDLTNYFNMTTNTSDDITEWTTNLFVTNVEKNTWNNKQDTLVAWNNITISWNVISATDTDTTYSAWDWINIDVNNVISNTAKFDPDNAGTMWQFLKKTNDGYQWADVPWGWTSYTAWDWIDITNNVISNTDRFNPTNNGTIWYVLKASWTNTYYWAPESWGWGSYTAWDWISISNHVITNTKPFEPDNWATGSVGQVITKTADGYKWSDIDLPSWDNNVKFWTLNSNANPQDYATQQEIYEWVAADPNNWAIINDTYTNDVFVFYKFDSSDTAIFYGTKRISRVSDAWNYTSQYQQELKIYDDTLHYAILVHENPDDATHTNYLSAIGAQYDSQNPFIPTEQYQPATKEYVDRVASWSITWVVTMDTTGTTYSASKIWVGTQAQYNQITPVNWVIYNII